MVRSFERAHVVMAWLLVFAGSQAADPRPITLGDAVAASALQAERNLAAVRAEVNAARADAAVAWEDLQRAAGTDAT